MLKFFSNISFTSRRSTYAAAGVLCCGALLLSGCRLTPEELRKSRPASLPQPKVPQLKPGELPKITVVPGGGESYWNEARRGAEAAGKQFGARVEWKVPVPRIPHRSEVALYLAQKELVEKTATTSQGLVVAPVDSTKMMQPVGKAARAGVAVVTFDRDIFTNQNKLSFVHNDDEATGVLAAQTAAKIDGSGSVTTVAAEPHPQVEERRDAFDETINKEFANMRLMQRDESYSGSPSWIFAADATSSSKIVNAPNLPAGIPRPNYILFTFDGLSREASGNKEIAALISPDYYQMGFQSVKAIMDFRATKQMPSRQMKIAPRVIMKETKPTNRSTP